MFTNKSFGGHGLKIVFGTTMLAILLLAGSAGAATVIHDPWVTEGYNGAYAAGNAHFIGQSFHVSQTGTLVSATLFLSREESSSGIFDINIYEFSEETNQTGMKLASTAVDVSSLPMNLGDISSREYFFSDGIATLSTGKTYLLAIEPRSDFTWVVLSQGTHFYGDGQLYFHDAENTQGWQSYGGDDMEFGITYEVSTPSSVHNIIKGTNYTTIQAAIDNASSGDEIRVDSGTYFENVDINKQLILRGVDNGGGKPVVDAMMNGSAITLSESGIILEGFTATNTGGGEYAGIKIFSNNNTVNNNIISKSCYAIYLFYSNNNILMNNTAGSNDCHSYSVYLYSSNNNTLNGNTISGGMDIHYYSNNNTISNNIIPSGIFLGSSNNNTLSGNTISNTDFILTASDGSAKSNYNVIYNNIFVDLNVVDEGNNIWNITKTAGINIVGGAWLGGNFWSGYAGWDLNGDGLGDTLLPYNIGGKIVHGGDYLPLVHVSSPCLRAPNITSFSPNNSTVINNVNESRTFSITTNQTVNVSWLINGTEIFNEIGVITSSYFNSSAALGTWNVTAVASNNNGTARQTWVWMVIPAPTAGGSITGFKINDTNGDGKWGAGENGISNWTIRLIGTTGKGNDTKIIRKETFTDATGFYKFDNLPAGRYFVIEKLKKGFMPTSSPVKRIKLAQDENSINNNFTNRPAHSLDKTDGQSDVDDYEAINRSIDKNKEDMDWD